MGYICEKNEKKELKSENEEQKINGEIKQGENNQKKALLALQITKKFSFENNQILKINELSNQRIGILLKDSFLIYDLKKFKKLYEIKLPVSNDYYHDEEVKDFIELKNSDLVLWSSDKISIYHKSGKKYQPYQIINGSEGIKEKVDENDDDGYFFHSESKKFEINSIYELTNGKLISCNSNGLTIYAKANEKYVSESKHEMEIDVRKIIELNPNHLILFQRYHYFWWGCSRNNFFSHTYAISLYDIETKNLTKLASNKVTKNDYYGYTPFSFLIKDKFLLVRYGNKIDIYDIKNNMLLLNHDQENMVISEKTFYGNYKILKDEMNIIFMCDYFDNLFIVKDKENKPKIYELQDYSFKKVSDFPFILEKLKEIIKLKNNALLMYSENQLLIISQK